MKMLCIKGCTRVSRVVTQRIFLSIDYWTASSLYATNKSEFRLEQAKLLSTSPLAIKFPLEPKDGSNAIRLVRTTA